MARRRLPRGYRSALGQARLEASIAYGPQTHALSQLLRQAHADYKTQIRIERGTARGIRAGAKAAIPKVKKDYKRAQGIRRAAQSTVNAKLAGLSPAADDIKAASAREAGLHRTQLAQQEASAVGEFRNRVVDARAAEQFAIQNARSTYRSDRSKIIDDLKSILGQRGKFTVASARTNLKADRQYRNTVRTNRRLERAATATITGVDPKTGKPTLAGKKFKSEAEKDAFQRKHKLGPYKPAAGPAAKKPKAETEASHKVKLQIDDARSQIRRLRARGWASTKITAHARKNGVSDNILNAARDLEYLGYLSRPNIAVLRRAGVRVPRGWRTAPRGSRGPSRHNPGERPN